MGKIIKFRKRKKAKLPEQWQEYRPNAKRSTAGSLQVLASCSVR